MRSWLPHRLGMAASINRSAVPRGWARARKTILSGNAVTFLAAAVLYVLAVGQVKGFAFTLGLTTILDVLVVFLVTWPLVYLASKSTTLAKPASLAALITRTAISPRLATRILVTGPPVDSPTCSATPHLLRPDSCIADRFRGTGKSTDMPSGVP